MKQYRLIVDDGRGYSVKITPNSAGEFDVEVWREKYAYVVSDGIGAINGAMVGYVERSEGHRLNICASTVGEIKTALQEFELTLPDSLTEELSDWQRDYLEVCIETIPDSVVEEPSEVAHEDVQLDNSRRGEPTYTKRGNVYKVDDGRGDYGQYATVAWSEWDKGFDVQIYDKFSHYNYYLDETVNGENHVWGSYMLQGRSYENSRSDYGATADGRITTVEGLQKALSQFHISWPKGLSEEISAEVRPPAIKAGGSS